MSKLIYITWTERRNKVVRDYVLCQYAPSVKKVKEWMQEEQAYRHQNKKPYMFFLKVSIKRPYDAERRTRGHLYY